MDWVESWGQMWPWHIPRAPQEPHLAPLGCPAHFATPAAGKSAGNASGMSWMKSDPPNLCREDAGEGEGEKNLLEGLDFLTRS